MACLADPVSSCVHLKVTKRILHKVTALDKQVKALQTVNLSQLTGLYDQEFVKITLFATIYTANPI